jgi:peptidoglycan/xylan/chitin deacetylase (PgdA/CDA1 family)
VKRVCVLTYHAIDERESVLSVSPGQLRAHLETIARSGRRVLPASRLASGFEEAAPVEDGSFVLTFDDGYASVARDAAPLLREFGFPYAIFLVTNWVGRDNSWPSQPSWVPRAPLADWGQIARLVEDGAELGLHTADHRALDGAPEAVVRQQIDEGTAEIERRSGLVPRLFAYPGGAADAASREIARSRFPACFGTRHARMRDGDDRGQIPRVETYYFRQPRHFARLFSPAIDARLAIRRAIRRVRRLL